MLGEDLDIPAVYEDLLYQSKSPHIADRQAFLATDLREFRTQLSASHYKELLDAQEKMRKELDTSGEVNIEPAMKKAAGYIDDILGQWDMKTTSAASPSEIYIKRAVTKIAAEEIRVREANNGTKELTQQEVEDAVDYAMSSVFRPTKASSLMQQGDQSGLMGSVGGFLGGLLGGEGTMWTMKDIIREYQDIDKNRDGSDFDTIPPGQLLDYAIAEIKRQGVPVTTNSLYMALLNYRKATK